MAAVRRNLVFNTLSFIHTAGVPGAPLPPVVKVIDEKQAISEVTWREPAANGPDDLTYVLQAA